MWEGPRGRPRFGIKVKHKKWFKKTEKRPRKSRGKCGQNPKPFHHFVCSPSTPSGRKPRPRGRLSTLCHPHYAFLPSAAPALSAFSAPSILDQLRSSAAFCVRLSPQTCHTPFHFPCVFSSTLPGSQCHSLATAQRFDAKHAAAILCIPASTSNVIWTTCGLLMCRMCAWCILQLQLLRLPLTQSTDKKVTAVTIRKAVYLHEP